MSSLAQQISALVRDGRMIDAIKALNEASGIGLRAAKEALEADASVAGVERALQGHATAPATVVVASAEVRRLAASGQMLAAIKQLRKETGLGLKDAKDEVDKLPRPPSAPLTWKGLLWIAAVAVLALAVWLLDLPLI
jgi:ribosomal protein L7/L12